MLNIYSSEQFVHSAIPCPWFWLFMKCLLVFNIDLRAQCGHTTVSDVRGVGRPLMLTVKLNRLQLKRNMVSQSIWLQEFIISTHFYKVCNVFTHVDVYLTHFSAKCTSDTRVVYLTFLRHQESLASDFYCS